jgi:glyoxylase-like metal-dependent hydrolase (beta-lactamase superfamily II)
MDVLEISPGLWRWTGYHSEWKEDVGAVYCETGDGVVLIDPIVPPEDTDRFWRALDRDVDRQGRVVHVLVTVFWHTRDSAAMVERYGARVWAPGRARAAIARRSPVSDVFRPDERLPGGIGALPTARTGEVVFWLPEHATLVPGDVLLGDGDGGLRLCPRSWLPAGRDEKALAESLRPTLELPVQRILVSHGEPVVTNAKTALDRALRT